MKTKLYFPLGFVLMLSLSHLSVFGRDPPQAGITQYADPQAEIAGNAAPARAAGAFLIDLYDVAPSDLPMIGPLQCGVEEVPEANGSTIGMDSAIPNSHRPATWLGSGAAAGRVRVDVMILYTSEALERIGELAMEQSIQYAIACGNETFRRSEVPVELRLVHHALVEGHKESGQTGSELSWLMHDPAVQRLQSEYGADLVSMIVARGQHAGLANCSGCYSVFCGTPMVFTHEIGHNFGCSHDRSRPAVCARNSFSYAHTFQLPNGSCTFGTIMSYKGSPIMNFSNPRVQFRGCATGVPEGHCDESGKSDSADNARTVTATAPEIAQRALERVSALAAPRFDEKDATFSFEIISHFRESHSVQYTTDFVTWYSLGEYNASSGRVTVTDSVPSVRARFYWADAGSRSSTRPIGFYRVSTSGGRALIANQLDNGENRVDEIFGEVPVGSMLYRWDATRQRFTENRRLETGWTQPDMKLHPGEGAILECDRPVDITFVGLVQTAFYRPTEVGWSLISSPLPQAGLISTVLGFPMFGILNPDRVSKALDIPQASEGWQFADGSWQPETEPEVALGEAFWSYKSPNSYIWKGMLPLRTMSTVTPPILSWAISSPGNTPGALTLRSAPRAIIRIESSIDLDIWTQLDTVTNQTGICSWCDPEDKTNALQFYRAVLVQP